MPGETSFGPAETLPSNGDRELRSPAGGVDAHAANEFDIRHGLAGAEAKPFGEANSATGPSSDTSVGGDNLPDRPPSEAEQGQHGLVNRPNGAFPPGGQQGAGADRSDAG